MGQLPRQFEQYTLLGEIATGGMGVVHQAVHTPLSRSCALKLISSGLLATPAERARFATEAEAASTLDHPGIVKVRRAGEHEGQWFLELELVEGGTLADRLTEGPLPPREAASLVERIARAVQHAHEHGILHRDLKPANVLLDSTGDPKLTDFGLARFLGRSSDLTRTLAVLGTPAYLAPEIAAGRVREATIAADIYSLGVILFECLTGRRPFADLAPLEILRAVQESPTPRPSEFRPGLPGDLEIITCRCLAREPERRFASAGDLADELARFMAGEPIHSRRVAPLERLWLWCKRRPQIAASVAIIAMGALAGLSTVLWQWRRAETANRQLEHLTVGEAITRAGEELEVGRTADALRHIMRAARVATGHPGPPAWLTARLALDAFLIPARDFSHAGEVGFVALEDQGRQLLTAGQDGVRLLDIATAGLLAHVEAEREVGYACLAATGSGVLAWDTPHFASLWRLRPGEPPDRLWQLTGQVAVAVSPARSSFAVARADGQVWYGPMDGTAPVTRVPDLPGQALLLALSGTPPVIAAALTNGLLAVTGPGLTAGHALGPGVSNLVNLALSPDGALLAVAGEHAMKIQRVSDGQLVVRRDFESRKLSLDFSPDLKRAVVVDEPGAIHLLDLANANAAPRLLATAGPVEVLRFTRSGHHFIAVGDDGNTRLCSVATPEFVASTDQEGFVWHADFDESSGLLATANLDQRARLFRLSRPPTNIPALFKGLEPGSVLPREQALVSFDMGGHVVTVQPADASPVVRTQAVVTGGVTITATSGVKPTAFVGDRQGAVWRVGLEGNEPPQRLFDGVESRRTIAVTTDGRWLAAGEPDRLSLAQLDGSRVLTLTNFAVPNLWSLAFSPRGDRLAAGCYAGQIAVFSTAARPTWWAADPHRGPVNSVAFSPDGRQLASASGDQSIRLWDAATGREQSSPLGHDDEVFSVAFDPVGTRLAAGSKAHVILWDLKTRARLAKLPLGSERVATVAFSPDGTRLLAANGSGRLALWDLSVPFRVQEWDLSVPGGLPASRSRAAWLDDHRVVGWSMSGIVRFVDLPATPRTELLLDLAEWITSESVTAAGAVSRLSDTERAQRFGRLRTATERGELPPALARHLTPRVQPNPGRSPGLQVSPSGGQAAGGAKAAPGRP